MRRFLASAVLLLAARDVSANSCNTLLPHVVTREIPLGCPLVAYVSQELTSFSPMLERDRAGQREAITPASVTIETETLDVYIESIDEACVEHDGYAQQPFDRYTVELADVAVGDVIYFAWQATSDAAIVEAAGPCPTAEPPQYLQCQDPIQEYWACDGTYMPDDPEDPADPHGDHDGGGCAAGGGLGIAAAALLLGLRRRRATRC